MSRLELNHIAWSKSTASRMQFDLADSSVAAPDLAELGLPHVTGVPRDAAETQRHLEAALGQRTQAPFGRVLACAGGSEAIAAVFAGLISPGEGVLAERPGYESHRSVAKRFGAKLRTFVRARERSFGATAEAVQSQLTAETRLVILTHLHNPTGAALETGDVDALDKLAEKHGFWILVDETLRDADPEQPLGTLARRGSRWVTISSLTKSYGLGGLRIGWIAGGADVLGRCADALNALSVQPASPSLALALALVPHLDDLRSRARRILQINHAAWAEFLSRTVTSKKGPGGIDLDTGLAPRGTTAWCLFGGDTHGDEFSAMCASKFDLAVVPGGFFGDSRGIRIGVGVDPKKFEAALEPLGRALEAFTPARTTA